jgi:xanthine dehydrogenase YagT iron-sulfur-binding subunit
MSGNLCRCGAYVSIVRAVARAAGAEADTAVSATPAASTKEASA